MCSSSAAHTLDTHRIMHAYLALVIALAAPALAAPAPARLGYEREIDSTRYNLVPKPLDSYVLNQAYLASQKNRAKLITRQRPDDAIVADNVKLESNMISIVSTGKKNVNSQVSDGRIRRRRGYNLENVRVPARYPYLPVPNYTRFRRWG
ncbi:uncharacterized protein LOC135117582 [Helicoverpa armigera]|uniref:uncharacterized protein LOC110370068 n=1 Tax=Helicoverpa armigera TaxID=29058 RepID=UPI0021137504|nr:uncharacterized protein LOC110370068 [Helicoverpa armigera]